MEFKSNLDKRRFIEMTSNGIIKSDLYDLIINAIEKKENIIKKSGNEIYQIYAMNNKNRNPNLTYIDFGECGQKLKEVNKLIPQDDILIFKIEYNSPDFKIPIIEYALFGIFGTKKLDLLTCSNIKVNYYIPLKINNYQDYLYNPENIYYKDKCTSSKNDEMTDLTLKDRKDLFNKNNMSLCENMCEFKGYEYNNIICECDIKIKFNSFLNDVDKYNLIYRFEQDYLYFFNFWVFKCVNNIFTKNVISNNFCSITILLIIFANFVGLFIFCKIEQNLMRNKIKELIDNKEENNSSRNIFFNNAEKGKGKINISLKRSNQRKGTTKIKNINNNNNEFIQQSDNYKSNDIISGQNKIRKFVSITDNELNYLSYFEAIHIDKRSFIEIYFLLIKTKHLLMFVINRQNDFNPRSMKISFLFSIFILLLTLNTIFVSDLTLHDLWISNGDVGFLYNIAKILFSVFITTIIKNILLIKLFPEKDIYKLRKIKKHDLDEIQEVINMSIMKYYLFFFANIFILCLIWIYITCFFMIFQKTKLFVIKNTFISLGIFLIAPFMLYLIPAFIRKIFMEGDVSKFGFCLYILVTILQVLF